MSQGDGSAGRCSTCRQAYDYGPHKCSGERSYLPGDKIRHSLMGAGAERPALGRVVEVVKVVCGIEMPGFMTAYRIYWLYESCRWEDQMQLYTDGSLQYFELYWE